MQLNASREVSEIRCYKKLAQGLVVPTQSQSSTVGALEEISAPLVIAQETDEEAVISSAAHALTTAKVVFHQEQFKSLPEARFTYNEQDETDELGVALHAVEEKLSEANRARAAKELRLHSRTIFETSRTALIRTEKAKIDRLLRQRIPMTATSCSETAVEFQNGKRCFTSPEIRVPGTETIPNVISRAWRVVDSFALKENYDCASFKKACNDLVMPFLQALSDYSTAPITPDLLDQFFRQSPFWHGFYTQFKFSTFMRSQSFQMIPSKQSSLESHCKFITTFFERRLQMRVFFQFCQDQGMCEEASREFLQTFFPPNTIPDQLDKIISSTDEGIMNKVYRELIFLRKLLYQRELFEDCFDENALSANINSAMAALDEFYDLYGVEEFDPSQANDELVESGGVRVSRRKRVASKYLLGQATSIKASFPLLRNYKEFCLGIFDIYQYLDTSKSFMFEKYRARLLKTESVSGSFDATGTFFSVWTAHAYVEVDTLEELAHRIFDQPFPNMTDFLQESKKFFNQLIMMLERYFTITHMDCSLYPLELIKKESNEFFRSQKIVLSCFFPELSDRSSLSREAEAMLSYLEAKAMMRYEELFEGIMDCIDMLEIEFQKLAIGSTEVPERMQLYLSKLQNYYNQIGLLPIQKLFNKYALDHSIAQTQDTEERFRIQFSALVNREITAVLQERPAYIRLGFRYFYDDYNPDEYLTIKDLIAKIDPESLARESWTILFGQISLPYQDICRHQKILFDFYERVIAEQRKIEHQARPLTESDFNQHEFLQGLLVEFEKLFKQKLIEFEMCVRKIEQPADLKQFFESLQQIISYLNSRSLHESKQVIEEVEMNEFQEHINILISASISEDLLDVESLDYLVVFFRKHRIFDRISEIMLDFITPSDTPMDTKEWLSRKIDFSRRQTHIEIPENQNLLERLCQESHPIRKYSVAEFVEVIHKYARGRYSSLTSIQSPDSLIVKKLQITDGAIRVYSNISGNLPELLNFLSHNLDFIKEGGRIIFNGNISGQGRWSVECMILVMQLATSNPGQFFIGRGAGETPEVALKEDNSFFEAALSYFIDAEDLPGDLKGITIQERQAGSEKYDKYKAYIRKLIHAGTDSNVAERRGMRVGLIHRFVTPSTPIIPVDLNLAFSCMPFAFSIQRDENVVGFVVSGMLPKRLVKALEYEALLPYSNFQQVFRTFITSQREQSMQIYEGKSPLGSAIYQYNMQSDFLQAHPEFMQFLYSTFAEYSADDVESFALPNSEGRSTLSKALYAYQILDLFELSDVKIICGNLIHENLPEPIQRSRVLGLSHASATIDVTNEETRVAIPRQSYGYFAEITQSIDLDIVSAEMVQFRFAPLSRDQRDYFEGGKFENISLICQEFRQSVESSSQNLVGFLGNDLRQVIEKMLEICPTFHDDEVSRDNEATLLNVVMFSLLETLPNFRDLATFDEQTPKLRACFMAISRYQKKIKSV
jgi:hypothetical protein